MHQAGHITTPHHDTQSGLRLLCFNMQVGIQTQRYHHYVTRCWQHLLPYAKRNNHLQLMARVFEDYDVVALQEADGGSFRSGRINQVEFLAQHAQFPHHVQQLNRNLGALAQHSNGLLSRPAFASIETHVLPGWLPGRGALAAQLEWPHGQTLHIISAHLALGARVQKQQLDFIAQQVPQHQPCIVMGDFNCSAQALLAHPKLRETGLQLLTLNHPSYPSWRPLKGLDHVLVSPQLADAQVKLLPPLFSDHLPLDIWLPHPT